MTTGEMFATPTFAWLDAYFELQYKFKHFSNFAY